MAAALLPPRLFPSIDYYAFMARHKHIAFDLDAPYNKADKGTHRFTIADNRGPLRLTVPVSKPSGAHLWRETTVSSHGRWYETMPVALETGYGRSPFFEFYIDRLMPLFDMRNESIVDLCLRADSIVRSILHLPVEVVSAEQGSEVLLNDSAIKALYPVEVPYYQVRAHEFGFIGGLSILDLIFNLGPEAELYLDLLNSQQPMLKMT